MSSSHPLRRLRFDVAYDGTEFHGWQVQPGLLTIQGVLQEILSGIEGGPVHVEASGRTDAGVHALAQVAAVTLSNPIPPDNFRRAVNRLLPGSIRIQNVRGVSLDFHPRYAAKRKTYEYRLFRSEVCPPFERRYVHHYPYPLREDWMREAAALFEGEHDFTAFAATDDRDALQLSKVRSIFHASIARENDLLVYRVCGSGFLKHMVRNMVGVLLEVGRGASSVASITQRLVSPGNYRPGPTAPPSGLFLISVEYD